MRCLRLYLSVLATLCAFLAMGQDSTSIVADSLESIIICKQPRQFVYGRASRLPDNSLEASAPSTRREILAVNASAGYQRMKRTSSGEELPLLNSQSDIATLSIGIVYKQTYPVKLALRYNRSKPFQLDNQYEVSVSFDDRSHRELIQQRLLDQARSGIEQKQRLATTRYLQLQNAYEEKRQFLQSPVYLQQQAEQQLRSRAQDLSTQIADSINIPSIPLDFTSPDLKGVLPSPVALRKRALDSLRTRLPAAAVELHEKLLRQQDSLAALVNVATDSIRQLKQQLSNSIDSINKNLATIYSSTELEDYARSHADSLMPEQPRWAELLMKTDLRFGKFIVDQSELTLNNIFIHGVSVKYGDRIFVRVSTGFYDFAFREIFSFQQDTGTRQKPSLLAVQFGRVNGKDLAAFNFYIGKKSAGYTSAGSLRTIAGFSLQRRVYVHKNLFGEIELAKSTSRLIPGSGEQKTALNDILTTFNKRTLAAHGKIGLRLPATGTDVDVSYRYWGQQFESFNASQYFNPQNTINSRVSQSFFKRRFHLTAGLKYTDFKTYGMATNMKSKTWMASANSVLRLRKMPVLTLGYYPGSQLYLMEGNKLYEYYYYVLNATVSHYWFLGRLPVQTSIGYNKFFNRFSDSLVATSQSAWYSSVSTSVKRFTFSAGYSYQQLQETSLSTIETGIGYSGPVAKLTGVLKNNVNEAGSYRLGYSVTAGLIVKGVGTVSVSYDQSYLPDRFGVFIPVNTFQMQLSKPINFKLWR